MVTGHDAPMKVAVIPFVTASLCDAVRRRFSERSKDGLPIRWVTCAGWRTPKPLPNPADMGIL